MQALLDPKAEILEGAQITLLLPLWARAKETLLPHPIIVDKRAVEIVEGLRTCQEYHSIFDQLENNLDDFYRLSQLIRARCIDNEIRAYLSSHPKATVVNIGAGLDTTFERVDNGEVKWYDLDLPEVVAMRGQFMRETDRSKFISKSMLDTSWFDDIEPAQHGLMFAACGVLFFLDRNQIRQLICGLANRFPGSEIAFDTMSRPFLAMSNWTVLRKGGMGSKTHLRWSIQSAAGMKKWSDRISIVDEYPMYSRVQMDPAWGRASTNRMKLVNHLHGINIFHLSFLPAQGI